MKTKTNNYDKSNIKKVDSEGIWSFHFRNVDFQQTENHIYQLKNAFEKIRVIVSLKYPYDNENV